MLKWVGVTLSTQFEILSAGRLGTASLSLAGPALLLAAILASIPVFWFGLSSLVEAWSIPEYSHGPIIPLISTFLFLRETRRVPPVAGPIDDRWPGFAVLLLGLAIGLLGDMARINDIVTYGFIVWVAGLVLLSFGFRRGVLFWPAVVHLAFMLPLPQFVYWEVSVFLQGISSQIGVWLIRLADIPVFLDGNIIDLGVYKLQVAEACSGLRYLFPMLSFSFVFAVLYQGPVWHKLTLLISAAPITVLMNSFRIGVIGVMVDNFGIAHAEGFLHLFEGWIIFVSCVVILFIEASLLQRLSRDPRSLSETLDIDFTGMRSEITRLRDAAPSPALVAAVCATAISALGWTLAPERSHASISRQPLAIFPLKLDDWSGRIGAPLDPRVERTLGADDYFGGDFIAERGRVNLFVAYYVDQTDGTGIHSPEACIPAGGWEVSEWERRTVESVDGTAVELNRAVIQKGASRQLVYFWFDLRGKRIAGSYYAKVLNLRDMLFDGRSDGALVRIITPIDPREPEGAADARLEDFMVDLVPVLPGFVPR